MTVLASDNPEIYNCVQRRFICNPARDWCRCWWLSESPEHWQRLAAIKMARPAIGEAEKP